MISNKVKSILHILLAWSGLALLVFITILALRETLFILIIVFILSYTLNPLLEKIEHKFKIRRFIASIIVSVITFLLFLAIPIFLIPFIINQGSEIVSKLPQLFEIINSKVIAIINHNLDTNIELNMQSIKQIIVSSNTSKIGLAILAPIARNSFATIMSLFNLILIPLTLFYTLNYWHKIIKFFDTLIPRRYLIPAHNVIRDVDKSLSFYLRGQAAVMLIMAIIYAVGLNIVGIPAATMIGILTGILVVVPYIGIVTGATLAFLMAFTQFTGISQIIAIAAILGFGNLAENFIITPYFVGNSIGLNAVMVVFALIVFGNLFGIAGIILALPLTAVTVVLLKHARSYYLDSEYYKTHI